MAMTIAAPPQNLLPTSLNPASLGTRKVWFGTLSGDSSYPTGGYILDPALFGLSQVDFVLVIPTLVVGAGGAATYWVWNFATSQLQGFIPAGTEVPNATSMTSAFKLCQVAVVGH